MRRPLFRPLLLSTAFVVPLLLATMPHLAQAQTGRTLMQEQERRHESASETTFSTMTIVSKRGGKRVRKLVVFAKKEADGASRSLLKFLTPRDIENVGLLTWQQPGDAEDDQWLYLAASRQTKRIVGGAKKNAFMGTDLAYEDLRPEDLDANAYKLAGEEMVDGHKTWIVEATPATDRERRESGYAKRIFWIRQDNYMTVKTSFRDRRDREVRRASFGDLEQIKGQMWRSNRYVYETVKSGGKTVTVVGKRDVAKAVRSAVFAPQNISRRPRTR